MTRRRTDQSPGSRSLFVGVVILSVIHVPLPQADYHNVRHHDGAGEVCEYHDHLLRWHPSAESDADVTLLHWHWFLPLLETADPHQKSDDDHHRPGSGPALHAHVGDGLVPEDWRSEPLLESAGSWRLIDQLTLQDSVAGILIASDACGHSAPLGPFSAQASPTDGLRAERSALFQRWNC